MQIVGFFRELSIMDEIKLLSPIIEFNKLIFLNCEQPERKPEICSTMEKLKYFKFKNVNLHFSHIIHLISVKIR